MFIIEAEKHKINVFCVKYEHFMTKFIKNLHICILKNKVVGYNI